jgi:transglutaminase-like putative cysteine protease
MTRRAVGRLIVGSWVVSLGWLVVRQIGRPREAFLEAAGTRLAPGAAFYQIVLNGDPMGNAGITLDTTLTGYRLTEVWNMDLGVAGHRDRHIYRADAVLSRSLRVEHQTITMNEAGVPRLLELQGDDSSVTLLQRRSKSPVEILSHRDVGWVTLPGVFPYRLIAQHRLIPGGSLAHAAMQPLFGWLDTTSARVTKDSLMLVADSALWDSTSSTWVPTHPVAIQAWRVERRSNGLPLVEWLDAEGRPIRRSWAFGLTLERSPFEVNYNQYQTDMRRGKILLPHSIPGARPRISFPGAPDTTRVSLTLEVARTDGPAWPGATAFLSGGRQKALNDTVVIHRVADSGEAAPGDDDPLRLPLPNPSITTVRAIALRSIPRGGDTLAHLVRWVHRSVRLGDDSLTSFSAAGAARTRRATVEGKVALLVELARSTGMAARAVTGVDVSRPELPSHSWAEVWRGDRWVAVDPVYGHTPAAASLLRVVVGAANRPLAMVPLVASLRTTVLTEQR